MHCMPVEYLRGEIVYREDEQAKKFYIINQGTVSLSKKNMIFEKKGNREIMNVLDMYTGLTGEIYKEI